MSFDEIFDLTAEVYFYYYNIPGICKGFDRYLLLVNFYPRTAYNIPVRTVYPRLLFE